MTDNGVASHTSDHLLAVASAIKDMTVSEVPGEPPVEEEKTLSSEDLFAVEKSQARLVEATANVRLHELQEQFDEAQHAIAQLQLANKAQETLIARLHKQATNLQKKQSLARAHSEVGTSHEALKMALGKKYGVDLNNTSYDDETGRLTPLPESTKES